MDGEEIVPLRDLEIGGRPDVDLRGQLAPEGAAGRVSRTLLVLVVGAVVKEPSVLASVSPVALTQV